MEWLSRTSLLIGEEQIGKFKDTNVLVVGLGGVGAYAAEQLARAGIGNMTIVDGDIYQPSNINRQLMALNSTLGRPKAEIMRDRILDINPNISVTPINNYVTDEEMINIISPEFDYIIDAIDTLAPKINLIYHSLEKGVKIVSSMGAGGKTDPMQIRIADIKKSYKCPLARVVRKRLHKLGIRSGVKVVFSTEDVVKESIIPEEGRNKKSAVGTISYLPPLFGCYCASVVVNDLLGK